MEGSMIWNMKSPAGRSSVTAEPVLSHDDQTVPQEDTSDEALVRIGIHPDHEVVALFHPRTDGGLHDLEYEVACGQIERHRRARPEPTVADGIEGPESDLRSVEVAPEDQPAGGQIMTDEREGKASGTGASSDRPLGRPRQT
jgi:hypothetical protein